MTNKDLVTAKLTELSERIARVRATRATSEQLARAVGLRNVVAHGYGRVDPSMVFAAATTGLADLSAFAREVAAWLAAQS